MGSRIEAVATTTSHPGLLARGSIALTDAAARACLERAGRRATELDLLVNAGVYKQGNVAEPALASIIQEDIGANPGHPPIAGRHGTFSFDVVDGACGCISAAYLIDGFLRDRRAELAMVVAGDADPHRETRGFPFGDVAGALLLTYADGAEGFERFAFRSFPEHLDLFDATVRWAPEQRGRNVLEVHQDATFAARCVEAAVEVGASFLASEGLRAEDIDLLVTSQYPPAFPLGVSRGLGIADDRLARVNPGAPAHTAGPLAGLEAAMTSGHFRGARNVLFVTGGAGISVAVALYRR